MGSDRTRDPQAYDNESKQFELFLPMFYIARYPITYTQYEAFVNSDGYTNDSYWTQEGIKWRGSKREPEYFWNDPQWHIGNHPVVGVTWYEAYALTRWLSAKLGYEIRLPTEAEWEKASRGTEGRIYPYGNDFETNKGNTHETGIGRTSAVGIFPAGASPYGGLDMSGNVWERCLSVWTNPYKHHDADEICVEGDTARVIRGGSWFGPQEESRAACRYGFAPDFRNHGRGFRVVCTSPRSCCRTAEMSAGSLTDTCQDSIAPADIAYIDSWKDARLTYEDVNIRLREILADVEARMRAYISVLEYGLHRMQTGHVSTEFLENLLIEHNDTSMPLSQLASLDISDAQTTTIHPFDQSMLHVIEQAIRALDLGLSINNDHSVIRLNTPLLTQEHCEEVVSRIGKRIDEAKGWIRNVRRQTIADIHNLEKRELITEVESRYGQDEMQHLSDDYIAEFDNIGERKKQEIMRLVR